MLELAPASTVNLFHSNLSQVEGALKNQRDFLRKNKNASLVSEPVQIETIRAIRVARQQGQPSVEIPIPDTIHAIEGLRRMATSLIESSTLKRDLPGEFAELKANGLRALANKMVNDVMEVYELTPDAQYELHSAPERALHY